MSTNCTSMFVCFCKYILLSVLLVALISEIKKIPCKSVFSTSKTKIIDNQLFEKYYYQYLNFWKNNIKVSNHAICNSMTMIGNPLEITFTNQRLKSSGCQFIHLAMLLLAKQFGTRNGGVWKLFCKLTNALLPYEQNNNNNDKKFGARILNSVYLKRFASIDAQLTTGDLAWSWYVENDNDNNLNKSQCVNGIIKV